MKKRDLLVVGAAGLLAAAGVYLVWNKIRSREDKPPKNAPQLDLENPGEQSEFPAAPHEERDLG